jgi:hypothetical protein
MTEAEWETCADPNPMLAWLYNRASSRKQRLFACACCRRVWPYLTDERCKHVIEVLERYADGLAQDQELNAALQDAWHNPPTDYLVRTIGLARFHRLKPVFLDENWAATFTGEDDCTMARHAALLAACYVHKPLREARLAAGATNDEAWQDAFAAEQAIQCTLLRDIIGNPFHPLPTDPAWLLWNNGAVPQLAQSIYTERRFADVPLLADTLTHAGCTDANILEHCRNGGEHVRGCWVLDKLLGRN